MSDTAAAPLNTGYSAKGVIGFRIAVKNMHYKVAVEVDPSLYIKSGSIAGLYGQEDKDSNLFIENHCYYVPKDKDAATVVKLKKWGEGADAKDLSKMNDEDYKKFQLGTYQSVLYNTNDNTLTQANNSVVTAIKTSDGTNAYFRFNGFLITNGLPGESFVYQTVASKANDTSNEKGTAKLTVTGGQKYNLSLPNTKAYLEKGGSIARDSGVLYVLLPFGVKYVGNPTATGVGNTKADVTAKEIKGTDGYYNGTGRTLMKFTISNVTAANGDALPQGNTYYPGIGASAEPQSTSALGVAGDYLQTGFSVTFDTEVGWSNINAARNTTSLVVYQEADDRDLIGDFPNHSKATMDDSSHIKDGAEGEKEMGTTVEKYFYFNSQYQLNNLTAAAETHKTTVYGTGDQYPNFDAGNVTGLGKKVSSSMSENYKDKTSVMPGEEYIYKLDYANGDSGIVSKIILYDVLEDSYGENLYWKGIFESVDTQILENIGVKPVVYYSTYDGFDTTDAGFNYDLNNLDQNWQTTMPEDKTTITAIAVDCSKNTDYKDFTLEQNQSLQVPIHMTAPDSIDKPDIMHNTVDGKANGKAYNRAAADIYHTVGVFAGQSHIEIDINYATQVTLKDDSTLVELTKNETGSKTALPNAYFLIKGTTDTHLLAEQKDIEMTVKSAASGDKYTDLTDGTEKNCTVGTLYEAAKIDVNNTPDNKADDVEKLFVLRLLPGEYTMKETIYPDDYENPANVSGGIYAIKVTEEGTLVDGSDPEEYTDPWTYDFDVTYNNGTVNVVDTDNGMLFNTRKEHPAQKEWLITFLDCNGNTVKVEWVKDGYDATAPNGFGDYAGYWNVTAHKDLYPLSCPYGRKGIIPNTGVKD